MTLGPSLQLHVHLQTDGLIRLQLKDSTHAHVPPDVAKRILFAWHEASFFGMDVHELTRNPMRGIHDEGLLIRPLLWLDWLLLPGSIRHYSFRLADQSLHWPELAQIVSDALLSGAWQPDPSGWTADQPAYRFTDAVGQLPAVSLQPDLAKRWLSAIMNDMTGTEETVSAAFASLRAAFPLLTATGHSPLNPEDWLIRAGWQAEPYPFEPVLCLYEPDPEAETGWTLQWRLRNRHAPEAGLLTQWPDEPEALLVCNRRVDAAEQIVQARFPDWTFARHEAVLRDTDVWMLLHETAWFEQQDIALLLPKWLTARQQTAAARLKGKAKPASALTDHLMSFDWQLSIGDHPISESEFRQLVERNGRWLYLDNRWVELNPEQIAAMLSQLDKLKRNDTFSLLDSLYMRQSGRLRDSAAPDGAGEFELEWDRTRNRKLYELERFQSLPPYDVPAALQADLRPYQQMGMTWLLRLRELGFGGILADDMGLGKTVQWIAAMLAFRQATPKPGRKKTADAASPQAGGTAPQRPPVLIICPTSVLGNWQREIHKFAPALNVLLHHGPQRLRGEEWTGRIRTADVIVTSYTLAALDEAMLADVEWDALVLDEAQHIKNPLTKQATAIRGLRARQKIAMSGTPVENQLSDLWSIMQTVNPGYLGSFEAFSRVPVEVTRRLIQPFLLRRMKNDPAIRLDLPDKIERNITVTLTPEQASLYEAAVERLFQGIAQASPMQRRGLILSHLMKLKQICNHPALLLHEKHAEAWAGRSNKWEDILALTGTILANGEKVLLFTQFLAMGHQLAGEIRRRFGAHAEFLHGGLRQPEREQLVSRFQQPEENTDELQALVLSLRAGGTGLNLTAATHVIHVDRWWNPAVEEQATDRAYRIGQTQVVEVHRFTTVGTLEEKIDAMLQDKKNLREQLIGNSEQWITEMSTDALRDLLSLRSEWID